MNGIFRHLGFPYDFHVVLAQQEFDDTFPK
jgi:hypothetical protein